MIYHHSYQLGYPDGYCSSHCTSLKYIIPIEAIYYTITLFITMNSSASIDLPQEISFKVCEFGSTPSDLSTNYILQEIKNICPYINVGRELIIAGLSSKMELLRKDITLLRSETYGDYLMTFKQSPPTISLHYESRIDLLRTAFIMNRHQYDNFRVEETSHSIDVILTTDVCNHQELEAIFGMLDGNTLTDMMIKAISSPGGPLGVMADVAPMLNPESIDVLRTTQYPISNLFKLARDLRDRLEVYQKKGYPLDLFMSGDNIIAVDTQGEQDNPFSAHDAIIYHYDEDSLFELFKFFRENEIYCDRDEERDLGSLYKTYIIMCDEPHRDRMNEMLKDMSDLCKLRLACSLSI